MKTDEDWIHSAILNDPIIRAAWSAYDRKISKEMILLALRAYVAQTDELRERIADIYKYGIPPVMICDCKKLRVSEDLP